MPRYALDFCKTHITMRATSPAEAIAWTSRNARVPAERITCRLLPDTNPPAQGTIPTTMKKSSPTKKSAAPAASKPAKAKVPPHVAFKRAAEATAAKKAAKPTLGARVEKVAKPKAEKTPKEGMSGLDAAALILKEAKAPMGAKEIVAAIQERKLAPKLGGATPHATIYAAMITEIAKKGAESRFARASEKGKFTAA